MKRKDHCLSCFEGPRRWVSASLLACLLSTGSVVAQGEEGHPSGPTPAQVDGDIDGEAAALALYREGLSLIIAGDVHGAEVFLERILAAYPDTSLEPRAQMMLERTATLGYEEPEALAALLEELNALGSPGSTGEPSQRPARPQPSGVGEFIASQTLIATTLGFQFPRIFNEGAGEEALALGTVIGAGVGLGGSYLYTRRHDVTLPEVQSIYWTQLTAGYNVRLLSAIFAEGWGPAQRAAGDVLGVAIATPLGWTLNQVAPRTSGQLSMAYSSAAWGGFSGFCIGTFLLAQSEDNGANGRYLLTIPSLLLADGALAGSYILGKKAALSRSRMRLINLGGALGALAVGATWIIVNPDNEPNEFFALGILGGAGVGLGIATRLTQGWDEAHHPEVLTGEAPSTALLAYRHGKLRFGQPMPLPIALETIEDDGQRGQAPGVSLQLLEGTW